LSECKNKKGRQENEVQTVYFGISAHSECADLQWLCSIHGSAYRISNSSTGASYRIFNSSTGI